MVEIERGRIEEGDCQFLERLKETSKNDLFFIRVRLLFGKLIFISSSSFPRSELRDGAAAFFFFFVPPLLSMFFFFKNKFKCHI